MLSGDFHCGHHPATCGMAGLGCRCIQDQGLNTLSYRKGGGREITHRCFAADDEDDDDAGRVSNEMRLYRQLRREFSGGSCVVYPATGRDR